VKSRSFRVNLSCTARGKRNKCTYNCISRQQICVHYLFPERHTIITPAVSSTPTWCGINLWGLLRRSLPERQPGYLDGRSTRSRNPGPRPTFIRHNRISRIINHPLAKPNPVYTTGLQSLKLKGPVSPYQRGSFGPGSSSRLPYHPQGASPKMR